MVGLQGGTAFTLLCMSFCSLCHPAGYTQDLWSIYYSAQCSHSILCNTVVNHSTIIIQVLYFLTMGFFLHVCKLIYPVRIVVWLWTCHACHFLTLGTLPCEVFINQLTTLIQYFAIHSTMHSAIFSLTYVT